MQAYIDKITNPDLIEDGLFFVVSDDSGDEEFFSMYPAALKCFNAKLTEGEGSRFGFEPIELFKNPNATIALIGFCPADATEWGEDMLMFLPKNRIALDITGKVHFTSAEIDEIEKVYRDM